MEIRSVTGAPTVKARFDDDDTLDLDISPEAKAMVIKSMTNLYDNPIEATAREVICNGFDAETETGNPQPVKITIPSYSDPNFTVEDHGIGMSYETVRQVYRMYGVSTKRTNNNGIGGFGFGCKVPLAIEKKFHLKTTKDGLTTVAEIYWDASENFKIDTYEPYESGLPNGTIVKVPLVETNKYAFERAIYQFLAYVPKDLYELYKDGERVEATYVLETDDAKLICELEDGTKVYQDNSSYSSNSHYSNTSTLVMGPVKYTVKAIDTIDYDRIKGDANNFTIVCPIGSVDLAPSRENVQMTKKSINFITSAYNAYVESFVSKYRTEIENAENHGEAIRLKNIAANYISTKGIQYKEKDFQRYVELTHTTRKETRVYDENTDHNIISRIDLHTSDKTYLVTDGDFGSYADSSFRRGIKLFMDYNDLPKVNFILLNNKEPKIESEWITDNPNFEFITREAYLETVKEQRKSARKYNPPVARDKISYLVFDAAPMEDFAGDTYLTQQEFDARLDNVEHDKIEKKLPYLTKQDLVNSRIVSYIDSFGRNQADTLMDFFRFVGFEGKVILIMDHKKPSALVKRTDAVPFKFDAEAVFNKHYDNYVADMARKGNTLDYTFERLMQRYSVAEKLDDKRFHQYLSMVGQDEQEMSYEDHNLMTLLYGGVSYRDAVQELFTPLSRSKHEELRNKFAEPVPYNTLHEDSDNIIQEYARYIPLGNYPSYTQESFVVVMNAIYNQILNPAPVVV